MTQRYHIPVVITTTDEISREEASQYVEAIVSNLEDTEHIYRTFVEDTGLDEAEVQRLLDMLERIEKSDIGAAMETLDEISDEE